MTEHPITLPRELVTDWCRQWARENDYGPTSVYDIALQAARWGADQELEACLDQLRRWGIEGVKNLRNTRRPKPPSLKQQALTELDSLENMGACNADTIRRALEALPDD